MGWLRSTYDACLASVYDVVRGQNKGQGHICNLYYLLCKLETRIRSGVFGGCEAFPVNDIVPLHTQLQQVHSICSNIQCDLK